jgi:hypothetical protein
MGLPVISSTPQLIGTDRNYQVTCKDSAKQPVNLTGATFQARVWPGGDLASLFTPATSLIDAAAGKAMVSVSAAQSLTLPSPGLYRLELLITSGGLTVAGFDGQIRFLPSPGSTAIPQTFCDESDLLSIAPWIEKLAGDAQWAGFLRERAEATKWLKRQAMSRVDEILEDQASRHGPIALVDPIVPTSGVDDGPWWGPSTIPDTTIRDQRTTYQTMLDTVGQLMIDSPLDNGLARQIVAHWAVHLVCRTQLGVDSDTPYQALAREFRNQAIRLLVSWTARIDTDADGIANYELD